MGTTIFLYGATGDLAAKLLLPALYRLECDGRLGDALVCSTGIEDWSTSAFVEHVEKSIGRDEPLDPVAQDRFRSRLSYARTDLSSEGLSPLQSRVAGVNIHYLALPPGLFADAATAIQRAGLKNGGEHRLVVEKPFGTDLRTATALDVELHRGWSEDEIFRIDHFLGKETVQNLTVTRFANRVFEPLLSAAHVDQVQITAAETMGVEERYRYYDGIGALRDMIQNHLMQLLCLAAMEPPAVWEPEVFRDHKVELLRSVRHLRGDTSTWAARGQYGPGFSGGEVAPGYRDEKGIGPDSNTETFAAVALHIDDWRWEGVPFYLRSGKRLGSAGSEIAYRFRKPPTDLFRHTILADSEPNWLVFRLNSPEGMDLTIQTKRPGFAMEAEKSLLHIDYGDPDHTYTAYELLLLDVLEGDRTPFLRVDEVSEAWRILDPVIDAWRTGEPEPYPAGSDGPAGQDGILQPGHRWRSLPRSVPS